jgi:signal transduction histidine kinase
LLRIRVRDDGRGINSAILETGRQGHYGLAGMRERIARIGGHLNILPAPGAGTEIELSIPGSIAYVASAPPPRFSASPQFRLLQRR